MRLPGFLPSPPVASADPDRCRGLLHAGRLSPFPRPAPSLALVYGGAGRSALDLRARPQPLDRRADGDCLDGDRFSHSLVRCCRLPAAITRWLDLVVLSPLFFPHAALGRGAGESACGFRPCRYADGAGAGASRLRSTPSPTGRWRWRCSGWGRRCRGLRHPRRRRRAHGVEGAAAALPSRSHHSAALLLHRVAR